LRGSALAAKGDHKRAVTDFDEAIKLNPLYVEAHNNRGLAYKALGRKAEAIADFRKSQSIDPTDQTSKDELKRLGG
jgi:Flp pilus assembly protein TadD